MGKRGWGLASRGLATGIAVGVAISLTLSLTGYLGEFNYHFELTSHFKLQYLIVGVCALIFFCFKQKKFWIAVSGICVLLNLAVILPWYIHPAIAQPNPRMAQLSTQPLRILVSNVYVVNRNYAALTNLIRQETPDLVLIVETNQNWLRELESVRDLLPYSLRSPNAEKFGVALYSNTPLDRESSQVWAERDPKTEDAQILANVTRGGKQILIAALHPPPPINQQFANRRNQHLQMIGQFVQPQNRRTIIIGDLNVSPWSPIYQKFERASGLVNSRKGFGILPTWTTKLPLLMIPIDHCLVSPDIQVKNTRTGNYIGSDHLPLIVDLAI